MAGDNSNLQVAPDRLVEVLGDPGNDRGRQIIIAAYELLAEGGLDGLTIRAVLTRTGLARRAFYERFGSKDDLVLAVFEQTLRIAASYYSHEAADLAGPLERLRFVVTSIVMGQGSLEREGQSMRDRRGAALSREHMRLAESRPQELQAALSPLLDLLSRYLSEGMADGTVRQADPARLAALVYNLVSTTVHTELLAEEQSVVDLRRRAALAEELWEFCRRAIAA
jgi:AcrR family transcriptional regulator